MTAQHWLPTLHVRAAAAAPDPSWGPGLFVAATLAAAFFLVLAFSAGRSGAAVRTPGRNLARVGAAAGVLTYWLIHGYSFGFDENLVLVYPPCSRGPVGESICDDYAVPALPFALACLTPLAVLAGVWLWQRRRAVTPPE